MRYWPAMEADWPVVGKAATTRASFRSMGEKGSMAGAGLAVGIAAAKPRAAR
jgi:hypothetical protein